MTSRFSGRKMAGSARLVKRRVFEGGVGGVIGGMDERSRVRFDRREADEEERECRGEGSIVDVVCVVVEEVMKFVVLILDCCRVSVAVVCDVFRDVAV